LNPSFLWSELSERDSVLSALKIVTPMERFKMRLRSHYGAGEPNRVSPDRQNELELGQREANRAVP